MKLATPMFEDLLKAAGKYQAMMEQANQAAEAFTEAIAKVWWQSFPLSRSKVAGTATRARGATSDLGQQIQRVVSRHRGVCLCRALVVG